MPERSWKDLINGDIRTWHFIHVFFNYESFVKQNPDYLLFGNYKTLNFKTIKTSGNKINNINSSLECRFW